jgi:hypothetical protein
MRKRNVRVLMRLLLFLVFVSPSLHAQTNQQSKPVPAPTKQPTAKKDPPTLGFNRRKDVPPILDSDAFTEGQKMEKELPKNEFVHAKEGLHETALMNEFMEGFKDSKECNGITFYLKTDKKPDFTVQIMVSGHDDPTADKSWTWILGYPGDPGPADSKSHGMGGMGSQSNARLTARDVCMTVWDDVDPNHFKKPGGKIE